MTLWRMVSASARAGCIVVSGRMIANSSPPKRASVALDFTTSRIVMPTSFSTWSPVRWP
jgi:hypothetical protein